MKKNFLKKLAFTMAFATAFTALSPAAGVFAAAKPSLTVGKKVTLLLGTEREEHDINVKNKVKGSTYKWTTGDKAIATVNSKGVVEGKKVGSAKVTLKITLPTKKTQTLTTTVDVKNNISEVAISNLGKLPEALAANETFDFDRKIESTFGGGKAHKGAITRWEVKDSEGNATETATISELGVFIATKAGEYTVEAISFQSKAKYADYLKTANQELVTARSEAAKVVVAPSIKDVVQVTPTELEIYFDADSKKAVTKDALLIEVNDTSKQRQIVDTVKFTDDGLKATVKTYLEFKNGVEYKITVNDASNLNALFTASKGDATYIKINSPDTVVFGTENKIEYGIYDANNVRIADSGAELEIIDGLANGYLVKDGSDWKVNVFEKGKAVTVKAKFSTGKVDETKYELIYLEDQKVILATDVLPTEVSGSKYTVAKTAPSNWDTVTSNGNLGSGDSGYTLFVQMIVKVNNKDVKHTDGFTYESMDQSKLLVGADGTLYPFATGTVYVKVTRDKLSVLVPVTIGAARKASSWTFDNTLKTVSNGTGIGDKAVFTATIKDNYETEIKGQLLTVTPMNNAPLSEMVAIGNNKVEFTPTPATPAGTYQYKVQLGDNLVNMLTVIVRDGQTDSNVATWRLEADSLTFDTARAKDKAAADQVELKLFGYNQAGTKVTKDTAYTLQLASTSTNPSANGVAGTVTGHNFNLTSVSGSAVVSGSALDIVLKAKTGTYLFEAVRDGNVVAKTAIVVNDSQTAATATQTAFVLNSKKGTDVLDVARNAFDAYVGGTKLNDNRIISVKFAQVGTVIDDNNKVANSGSIVINEVQVAQVFEDRAGNSYVVIQKVTVNKSVNVTATNN